MHNAFTLVNLEIMGPVRRETICNYCQLKFPNRKRHRATPFPNTTHSVHSPDSRQNVVGDDLNQHEQLDSGRHHIAHTEFDTTESGSAQNSRRFWTAVKQRAHCLARHTIMGYSVKERRSQTRNTRTPM